jgi:hypothetical protein
MRTTLASAAIGAGVGLLFAVLAATSGYVPFAGNKKMAHATITLHRIDTSTCRIVTTPQTLEVGKNETVEWSIVDLCGVTATYDVEIEFTGPKGDPLDARCVKRGRKSVRCRVKDPAPDYDFYKYEIRATGAITEDPELEIVQ